VGNVRTLECGCLECGWDAKTLECGWDAKMPKLSTASGSDVNKALLDEMTAMRKEMREMADNISIVQILA
jgi:hypothetical protein